MAYEKVARTGTRSSPHVGELHLLRRRRTGASAGKANSGRGGDRASYAHLGNTHGHKSDHRHTGAERKLHGCAREGAGEKPGGEVASSWEFRPGRGSGYRNVYGQRAFGLSEPGSDDFRESDAMSRWTSPPSSSEMILAATRRTLISLPSRSSWLSLSRRTSITSFMVASSAL